MLINPYAHQISAHKLRGKLAWIFFGGFIALTWPINIRCTWINDHPFLYDFRKSQVIREKTFSLQFQMAIDAQQYDVIV